MKAILEFNLPEEDSEHNLALNGANWMGVCFELDQWLRNKAKHEDVKTLTVQAIRDRLHEEMESAGLRFD